jgi:hypothetical protein
MRRGATASYLVRLSPDHPIGMPIGWGGLDRTIICKSGFLQSPNAKQFLHEGMFSGREASEMSLQ